MHACTVVNIPLCLPYALLSAPLYGFALLFPSSCSLFVSLAALLLCCLLPPLSRSPLYLCAL